MTNLEALKQMPGSSFANMVFDVVKNRCETLEDFENFLNMEIRSDLEPALKEALENLREETESRKKQPPIKLLMAGVEIMP